MSVDRGAVWVWLERALFVVGLWCVGWCAYVAGEAAWWQREQRRALHSAMTRNPAVPARVKVNAKAGRLQIGEPIGELDVPRLQLSAVVIEGDDDASLKVAAGHLPDTPLPWEGGNTAFAAHRDTYFRPLKDIKPGDIVRLSTLHGTFTYRVSQTMIANPDDLSVLNATERPALTLITCYPFTYVGHAPKRFVVRAEWVEGAQQRAT